MQNSSRLSRRQLFTFWKSEILQASETAIEEWFQTHPEAPPRPPGALTEKLFLAQCQRCGSCISACTRGCLRPAGAGMGLAAGSPILDPVDSPCNLCGDCIEACPSGALSHRSQKPMPTVAAHFHPVRCLVNKGAICSLCVFGRPPDCTALTGSGFGPPVIQSEKCNGCGSCSQRCPVTPSAITLQTIAKNRLTHVAGE